MPLACIVTSLVEIDRRDPGERTVRRRTVVHCPVHETSYRIPVLDRAAYLFVGREFLHHMHKPVVVLGERMESGELLSPALARRRLKKQYNVHGTYYTTNCLSVAISDMKFMHDRVSMSGGNMV